MVGRTAGVSPALAGPGEPAGHVFISYGRDDSAQVEQLHRSLEAAGVRVWRDTTDLRPGEDWRAEIRRAIGYNTLIFIACFSQRSLARARSYQNEELLLAVEELRLRRLGQQWFIPVRLDDCDIPDIEIGGGRTLASLERVDLFGDRADEATTFLLNAVLQILEHRSDIRPLLDRLYALDQTLVADSINALRRAAKNMTGSDLDPLGPEGSEALIDSWDVFQNYAEQAFPERHHYSRTIIDESYDPMFRLALNAWAEQNAELLRDEVAERLPAFDYAAAINLEAYAREFDEFSPSLEAAFEAGRLPCPPGLVTRSPELARLAMRLWRLTSADSPERPTPARQAMFDPLTSGISEDLPVEGPIKHVPSTPDVRRPRSRVATVDDRPKKSVLDVLEHIFRLEADTARMLRAELKPQRPGVLRRQRPGMQQDTEISFHARAVETNSICHVEYENYTSSPPNAIVVDKVLQAEDSFEDEPLDHWILISPHHDPDSRLARYVQRWNSGPKVPFIIQIWSPQSGVRDLFSLDSDIYRGLYGGSLPDPHSDPAAIVAEFTGRLRPPVRLPAKLSAYLGDAHSFVERKEFSWLDELDSQIERFGFDEKGARLSRSLQTEILSVLFDSRTGSNVALVLAEFGEGKSFFTVSLCAYLRNLYLAEPWAKRPIPIRMLLRGYRDLDSPNDFLRTQLEQIGLSMEDWPELIRREVLIILDGLDEISVRQDPATTRANLDKIDALLELLEGLPILVTSRPHFFSSGPDRERFYDSLRRPHVFRMGQPDRRETVAHLRGYADSRNLAGKLNKIKELYDPIGLAGKVLFLEMIKDTLPDLPEDRFDELVLYETYVERSLKRKIKLLRDPSRMVHDSDLRDQLQRLLETIAIEIHVSGEGSVDLREFVAEAGGAAKLLWKTSEAGELYANADEDATARIGGRSLLRRVSRPDRDDEESWRVDFFHRSMKEYFVAMAIWRALMAPDPYPATRELLIRAPVQPEILGFFKLLGRSLRGDASAILANLAHSARVGTAQGLVGGGAISLYYAIGDHTGGSDWRYLDLDGALLAGADLSRCDLRSSTLRGADLSLANLTGADLRGADLTDADLAAGGSIIALSHDVGRNRYICLTPESGLGKIGVRTDGSLGFLFIPLPRTLRSPQNLYALAEDLYLITARSEFLIVEISGGAAEEVTHFRVPGDIRSAGLLDRSLLGLLFEPEQGRCEAILTNIHNGKVVWKIPVAPHGAAYGWSTDGIAIAYESTIVNYTVNTRPMTIGSAIRLSGNSLCILDDRAVAVTDDGHAMLLPLDGYAEPEILPVHKGAGTAVVAADTDILTAGSEGSVALVRRDDYGGLTEAGRLERRLRCSDARVEGMKREHERLIFLANDAIADEEAKKHRRRYR